jgi:hypothetical protein
VRTADRLHDLLIRIGDLTLEEIAATECDADTAAQVECSSGPDA